MKLYQDSNKEFILEDKKGNKVVIDNFYLSNFQINSKENDPLFVAFKLVLNNLDIKGISKISRKELNIYIEKNEEVDTEIL